MDTPFRGRKIETGPLEALAFSAMISPRRAFSSTLVRISVMFGFHLCNLRSLYFSGTVSGAQKFTMSRQPGTITWGMPALPAASMRSGPAVSTPPTSSSAHSVVVMSSTPSIRPSSIRPSMVRPPAPVQ